MQLVPMAGYPEAHPDAIGPDGVATPEAYKNDLAYLKKKVGSYLLFSSSSSSSKFQ